MYKYKLRFLPAPISDRGEWHSVFAAHSKENVQTKTHLTATSHSRNNVSVTLDNQTWMWWTTFSETYLTENIASCTPTTGLVGIWLDLRMPRCSREQWCKSKKKKKGKGNKDSQLDTDHYLSSHTACRIAQRYIINSCWMYIYGVVYI